LPNWLDDDGHVSLFANDERKAVETAELLRLGSVTVDERLGEAQRPWFDDAADH